MNKKPLKKTKKSSLRNLAPLCFELKSAKWEKSQENEIEKIRVKYEIPSEFGFAEHLAKLPMEIASFQEGKKQIPTTKEKHQYVDMIRRKAEELLVLLHSSGSLILSQVARNTENTFKTITQLRDENLPNIIEGCNKTKYQLPPVKKGRHRDPVKFAVIHHLVCIYVLGTKREPTCGYDDIKKGHVGECFNFIADLNTFILKSLDLHFDEESTIGQYLHESLQYRKTKLLDGYAKLACYLSSEPNPSHAAIIRTIVGIEAGLLDLKAHPHHT